MSEKPNQKWDIKAIVFVAGTITGVFVGIINGVQNYYITRENSDIKHRLDVRDAYFNKGLIDRSKLLEEGYAKERRHVEKFIEHCKTNTCNLPPELAVMQTEVRVKPLDEILTGK